MHAQGNSMSSNAMSRRHGAGAHVEFDFDEAHRVRVGMVCFLCSEVAFFGTLIVAYLTYLGQDTTGPTPAEVLSRPLVVAGTAALLASSLTAHLAVSALAKGAMARFRACLAATISLGVLFLAGTAVEWQGLIRDKGLLISTNLFGTTYYTLVGFHALHVTVGVLLLSLMLVLSQAGVVSREHREGFEVVSWYWHFVDGVWVVVFTVVYVIGF